jgi:type VI secretion system secreted protein Hcp
MTTTRLLDPGRPIALLVALAATATIPAVGLESTQAHAQQRARVTSTATAASAGAYIKFDGIDGESTDKTHQGWSDLASFSQAIHRSGGGSGQSRRPGAAVVEDLMVSKTIDKASPKLAEACANGKVFPKVEIHLAGSAGTYYAYELTNVRISSYSVHSPESGVIPVEEVALYFEKIRVTYTEYDAAGRARGNVEYTWNVEEGES